MDDDECAVDEAYAEKSWCAVHNVVAMTCWCYTHNITHTICCWGNDCAETIEEA